MELISIVIPAYNVESYLTKAVTSCIEQTYKNIEIIIVDDGSTDNTANIADELSEKYKNVKTIHTSNQGLSMARNNGYDIAKGDYIYFLDSDDWIDPECIECCINELKINNLDFVTFDSRCIKENEDGTEEIEKVVEQMLPKNRVCSGTEFALSGCKRLLIYPETWRSVYRKSFLDKYKIKFIKNLLFEDNPFHLELLKNAKRVKYIPKVFYNYRIRTNSIMTKKLSIEKINSTFFITNFFLDYLYEVKNNSNIWKTFVSLRIAGIWKYNFINLNGDDFEFIQKNKTYINKERLKIINKIKNIYNTDSVDDIRNICRLMEIIFISFGKINDENERNLVEIIKKSRETTMSQIRKLPLNKRGITVGIYGCGVNSDDILRLYEKEMGAINVNLLYIDSYVTDNNTVHNDIPVINVGRLKEYRIDEILILSISYEKEMLQTIKNLYGDLYKVTTFYGEVCTSTEGTLGELYDKYKSFESPTLTNTIYFMATPDHGNIGDNLLTLGTYNFLRDYFSEYNIIEITQYDYYNYRGMINSVKRKSDIILICGGGFLGSLWKIEYMCVEMIMRDFKNNKIVVLPQTIFYGEEKKDRHRYEIDRSVMGETKDLTICFREYNSKKRFLEMELHNIKTYVFPDMAFNYDIDITEKRNGIGICIRKDKEKVIYKKEKQLKNYIYNGEDEVIEFSMLTGGVVKKKEREAVVNRKLREIASYKMVVTDRLHCMIACAITNTPCIVFDNRTKKVSGVYQMIPQLEYINLIDDSSNMKEIILFIKKFIVGGNPYTFDKTLFIKDYEKMAQIIKERKEI